MDKTLERLLIVLTTFGLTTLFWIVIAHFSAFPCENPKCDYRVQYTSNYCSHCGKQYRITKKGGEE